MDVPVLRPLESRVISCYLSLGIFKLEDGGQGEKKYNKLIRI